MVQSGRALARLLMLLCLAVSDGRSALLLDLLNRDCLLFHALYRLVQSSNLAEVQLLQPQSLQVKLLQQVSILVRQATDVPLALLVRDAHRFTNLTEFEQLALLGFYMLQSLFKFNITLVNLYAVVILAQVANFFAELFEVMGTLHHFELVARIVLLLVIVILI